jgi:hypothetical protein
LILIFSGETQGENRKKKKKSCSTERRIKGNKCSRRRILSVSDFLFIFWLERAISVIYLCAVRAINLLLSQECGHNFFF